MPFYDQKRGLIIRGTNFKYLTEGAYAAVFSDGTHVIKIFKSNKEKNHCTAVFCLEVTAYAIAMGEPELRSLVPGFRTDLTIEDSQKADVTAKFYSDLAYELDFIDGEFSKITAATQIERDRVTTLFRQHKISHMTDPSVLLSNGRIVKIIDFSVEEIELEAD